MNDLMKFLTSKDVIIVYIVSIVACLLVFIIYLVEKNNVKRIQKHNTKELNKLVEQVKEETCEDEKTDIIYNEPVIEQIESISEVSSVSEMIDNISKNSNDDVVEPQEILDEQTDVQKDNIVVLENIAEESLIIEDVDNEEELEYTTIEPDQETAKLELKKLVEELKKQEELEKKNEKEEQIEVINVEVEEEPKEKHEPKVEEELKVEKVENIKLTNYEEEQEENAIISLEELLKKSKEIYEANELTQYKDEGNEPISLEELEKTIGQRNEIVEEPFIIENVVDEKVEVSNKTIEFQTPSLNEVNRVVDTKETKVENKRFKSSPIISPIYGIEKSENSDTDIQLENTANYEKFDEEIKKTNEFLMTLKELQHKLD